MSRKKAELAQEHALLNGNTRDLAPLQVPRPKRVLCARELGFLLDHSGLINRNCGDFRQLREKVARFVHDGGRDAAGREQLTRLGAFRPVLGVWSAELVLPGKGLALIS